MRRRSSYTPRPRDTRVGIDEPCTINADVIAEYLERRGKPRMAAFVRILSDQATDANGFMADLRSRLEKYEPTVVPPPMRSARSEWD